MKKNLTLYHNPRCSKSRQTLKLLEDRGVHPLIVEYLKEPLSLEKLKELGYKLKKHPKEFTRIKEAIAKELNVDWENDVEVYKAIQENPVLLERPIVESDTVAVIGRPPENVLSFFQD